MGVLFPEIVADDVTLVLYDARFFSGLAVWKWNWNLFPDECGSFPEHLWLIVVIDVELRVEDFVLVIGKGPSQLQFCL